MYDLKIGVVSVIVPSLILAAITFILLMIINDNARIYENIIVEEGINISPTKLEMAKDKFINTKMRTNIYCTVLISLSAAAILSYFNYKPDDLVPVGGQVKLFGV